MIRVAALCVLMGTGFVVAGAAGAHAQSPPQGRLALGAILPPLRGQFLTGRDAMLPEAAKGKVALLLLGFTYSSRFAVEAWNEHFIEAFSGKPDVTSFQVPVIGGMARLGGFFINRGMRSATPKELHERVITVYGGVNQWKTRVGFSDRAADVAHLIVLDGEGRIRWLHNGPFDQQAFEELREMTARLTAPAGTNAESR